MGKGGGARTRTLLGKLAFGLLLVCFYVAGTNYVLFSSVVIRDEETLGGTKLFASKNKKKKNESENESENENNPIAVEKKAVTGNDPPSASRNHHGPSELFLDRHLGEKAAIVAEAASGPSKPNRSATTTTTTKEKNDPPPKSLPRDGAIYTCTYGKSKENRTTVVAPRNAPVFIIIGVQKSGSTALLTHFRDHPQMLQTKLKFRREAHFFDTSWQNGVVKASAEMGMVGANDKSCLALEKYMKLFETEMIMANSQTMAHYDGSDSNSDNGNGSGNNSNKEHNNATHHLPLYTFEKTPSYFENPEIPSRVKQTVPWSKIILVLRNPIDRLYSQYKMTVRNDYNLRKYSLEDFVFHELKAMKKYKMTTAPLMVPVNASNSNNSSNNSSNADPSVQVIADHYQIPDAVPFDHAVLDSRAWNPKDKAIYKKTDGRDLGRHILLRRGLYSTQLKWWLNVYTAGEDLLVINYDDLAGDTRAVYETVCRFTGIPIPYGGNQTPADVGIDFDKKVRADDRKNDRPLRNDTRRYLGEFYAPYTAELEDLLGPEWSLDKLGWN